MTPLWGLVFYGTRRHCVNFQRREAITNPPQPWHMSHEQHQAVNHNNSQHGIIMLHVPQIMLVTRISLFGWRAYPGFFFSISSLLEGQLSSWWNVSPMPGEYLHGALCLYFKVNVKWVSNWGDFEIEWMKCMYIYISMYVCMYMWKHEFWGLENKCFDLHFNDLGVEITIIVKCPQRVGCQLLPFPWLHQWGSNKRH